DLVLVAFAIAASTAGAALVALAIATTCCAALGTRTSHARWHGGALERLASGSAGAFAGLLVISLALHILGQTFLLAHLLEATHHLLCALTGSGFDSNGHGDS